MNRTPGAGLPLLRLFFLDHEADGMSEVQSPDTRERQRCSTSNQSSTRTLLRVTWDTASEADNLFSILMRDNVENRHNFIEEHALEAKNLDI